MFQYSFNEGRQSHFRDEAQRFAAIRNAHGVPTPLTETAEVYYPVTTLPVWLQPVAWVLPPTYVFEGMRTLLIQKVYRGDLMLDALALNAVLFAAGVFGFLKLLQSARRHGSLMQTGE